MKHSRRRQGSLVIEAGFSMLLMCLMFLAMLDVCIAETISSELDAATDKAVREMSVTRSLSKTLVAAQDTMIIGRSCVQASASYYTSLANIDMQTPGISFSSTAPSTAKLVRLQISCSWNWLTPAFLAIGPSANFVRISGSALE